MISETEVLDSLRLKAEGDAGSGWQYVYLPLVKSYGTPDSVFTRHLASLQKAGLYREADKPYSSAPGDKSDWGQVQIATPSSTAMMCFFLPDADDVRYCRAAGLRVEQSVVAGRLTFHAYAKDQDEFHEIMRRLRANPLEIAARQDREHLQNAEALEKIRQRDVVLWVVIIILLFWLLAAGQLRIF